MKKLIAQHTAVYKKRRMTCEYTIIAIWLIDTEIQLIQIVT